MGRPYAGRNRLVTELATCPRRGQRESDCLHSPRLVTERQLPFPPKSLKRHFEEEEGVRRERKSRGQDAPVKTAIPSMPSIMLSSQLPLASLPWNRSGTEMVFSICAKAAWFVRDHGAPVCFKSSAARAHFPALHAACSGALLSVYARSCEA